MTAQIGSWGPVQAWPMVGAHLLHHVKGQVLAWGDYNGTSAHLWDPANHTFTPHPNNVNIFCAGHAATGDGLYVNTGGLFTINSTQIFDYGNTNTWLTGPAMNFTRFYPTCTTLGDGRILVTSGGPAIPEVYTPGGTWVQLPGASKSLQFYPFMFLMPDGRVFYSGPDYQTAALNVATQTWTNLGNSVNDGGSAVMYLPGKVMKCGSYLGITNTTEIIDLNVAAPAWQQVGNMAFARHDHNLTILPDGTVLVTGGFDGNGLPVHAAELWNPATNNWTTMASMVTDRLYHSTAQLLNDGRVVAAGGDGFLSSETYSPPYLFLGARPTITAASAKMSYGVRYSIRTPNAAKIKAVNLVRLGAVTHSFDQNQRFVPLKFSVTPATPPATPTSLVVTPPSKNIAPPGAYMLFLVNSTGVPSIGHYVIVG